MPTHYIVDLLDRCVDIAGRVRATGIFFLYQRLPKNIRSSLSRFYWRQFHRRVEFPILPLISERPSYDASCGEPHQLPGINMYGFFSRQFGLGESARLYARALREAGVGISIQDLDIPLPHAREQFLDLVEAGEKAEHSIDWVGVNPDFFAETLSILNPQHYRIASWFWELEAVPPSWIATIDQVDEIMVASNFVKQAFLKVTSKPVLNVPLPIFAPLDSGANRADFGLPDDAFLFLTTFDFHSSIIRKNPAAVIQAFQQAFPKGNEKVCLLIKSSHGEAYPQQLKALVKLAAKDGRILIRDGVLNSEHLKSLQRCCDVYVSLHSAEGFGLAMAECMAIGKAVIATAWSGNMEYMTNECACLVTYQLVDVPPDAYPLAQKGAQWAMPDIKAAAAWMSRLAERPQLAREIGEHAAAQVKRVLAPERVAEQIMCRLEVLAKASRSQRDVAGV